MITLTIAYGNTVCYQASYVSTFFFMDCDQVEPYHKFTTRSTFRECTKVTHTFFFDTSITLFVQQTEQQYT